VKDFKFRLIVPVIQVGPGGTTRLCLQNKQLQLEVKIFFELELELELALTSYRDLLCSG
jgi:hypothetical protein